MTGRHDYMGRGNDLAEEPIKKCGENRRGPVSSQTHQITETRPVDSTDLELGRERLEERGASRRAWRLNSRPQEDNRGPASGFSHADRVDGIIPTVANRPGAHGLMPLRLQMLGCRGINVLCFSAGYGRTAAATLTGED